MSTLFRPMLATDFEEARLRFPYHASPKLDGIRCLVIGGGAKTRTMKRLPNQYVHEWFLRNAVILDNMDGELIVGDPTAKDVYAQTASGIMAINGRPDFRFHVFDLVDPTGSLSFKQRSAVAIDRLKAFAATVAQAAWLPEVMVDNINELLRFEEKVLELGFEGVMLRHPGGRYKQGRATVNENTLLKVKRFSDAEAVVVGCEEQMHNANVGRRNDVGRTVRSSAKAGKVGKGTLGALIVEGLPGQPFAGIRFNIGTGFDDELRAACWGQRAVLPGSIVRYRYFDIGIKDSPRFPTFQAFRNQTGPVPFRT